MGQGHRLRGLGITGILVIAAFFAVGASSARAAEATPGGAEEIARTWSDAVVHVKVVLLVRVIYEGREVNKGENEIEAIGTVVDPSGLTVLSFSNIDPSRIYSDILKKAKAGGEGAPKVDIETDIGAVKMLLPDENEVPARIVLRDKDLDLVFVKPTEKLEKPMRALDLSKNAKPAVLEEILILTRLGPVVGRVPAVSLHRIEGVARKPRTYYTIDQNAVTGRLGAPVFSKEGKVVGVYLLRVADSQSAGPAGFLDIAFGGMGRLGFFPVILPADEIASVARQALEAKEDKKDGGR